MQSTNRVFRVGMLLFIFSISLFAANSRSHNAGPAQRSQLKPMTKTKANSHYLHDKIIIKLKNSVTVAKGSRVFGISAIDAVLSRYSVTSVEKMFTEVPSAFSQKRDLLSNIYIAQYTSPVDAFELAKEIEANADVEYAEPWFIYEVDGIFDCSAPNDSARNNQWALNRVKADSAFCAASGSDSVVIGIIDTGVQWNHPDLAANIWINPNEIEGNNVDDDGNGKVDDYHGWDFGGANYNTPVADNNPTATSNNVAHGTHVAGIASAVTNNNRGVAGMANNCKIVPLKAASDNDTRGSGATAYIVFGFQAMKYAADLGVDIVNCSWGGGGYSQFEQDVVEYAYDRGTLVVAAAGNTSAEEDQYPAAYNHVLSVSARGYSSGETKASYSTYHVSVDVSAPGGDGTSVSQGILSTYINNGYAIISGTSMASPLVAGLVGLTKSSATVQAAYPNLTSFQAAEQVRVTADPKENQPSYYYKQGRGRVNALRAVTNTNFPALRMVSYSFDDVTTANGNGNGIPDPGETLYVKCTFENYLKETSTNAKVTLVSFDGNVISVVPGESQYTIGQLPTSGQASNFTAPFKIVVGSSVANNKTALMRFEFSDPDLAYTDFQGIWFLVNPLYSSHRIGSVDFSVSNFGSLGYFDYTVQPDGQFFGDGFQYPIGNASALFHGTLLVATDSNHVVDNAFGNPSNQNAVDWKTSADGKFSFPSEAGADQVFRCAYTDSGMSSGRIGVKVVQRSYAFSSAPDDDYILLRFDIYNPKTGVAPSDTLRNVYVGIFTDWDVEDYPENKVDYDSARSLGYMWDSTGTYYYGAAIVDMPATSFRAIHNPTYVYTDGASGGFSEGNKYRFMTDGFQVTKSNVVQDWSNMISVGPFTIAPQKYQKISVALVGGDNLADLQANTDAARAKASAVLSTGKEIGDLPSAFSLYQNYPNPFNPVTMISYSLPERGHVSLKVYDIMGHEVATLVDDELTAGTHRVPFNGANLASGVYYYRMMSGNHTETKKFMLVK